MKKIYIILSILTFIIITIFVLCFSDTSELKKVSIRTQGVAISQQGTHLGNKATEIENKEINIEQEKIDYSPQTTKYSMEETSYNKFSTSKSESKQYNYNYDYSELDEKLARLKNIERTINQNKHNKKTPTEKEDYIIKNNIPNDEPHGYGYEDIDWSIWKSNFINKILDDSMSITSLNDYKIGTWFYYSFNVTNTGEIKDVTVRSFTLKESDKQKIKNIIYNYAHKSITVFPRNSKRKSAKVEAIMLLGETEEKSRPEDFNDTERIRIKY